MKSKKLSRKDRLLESMKIDSMASPDRERVLQIVSQQIRTTATDAEIISMVEKYLVQTEAEIGSELDQRRVELKESRSQVEAKLQEIDAQIETLRVAREKFEADPTKHADLERELAKAQDTRSKLVTWRVNQTLRYLGNSGNQTPEGRTLDNYMVVLSEVRAMAQIQDKRQRETTLLWTWLRDARIFHLPLEVYKTYYQEADRYTTEQAGLEYQPPGKPRENIPQEETKQYVRFMRHQPREIPYPDQFPFPRTYLGFGGGIPFPAENLSARAPKVLQDRIVSGLLLGCLLTEDGNAYGFVRAILDNGNPVVWVDEYHKDGEWVSIGFLGLEPWVLPALINLINEQRTFIVQTGMPKEARDSFKENRRKLGLRGDHVPPPYYVLRVESKVIQDQTQRAFPPRPSGYHKSYRSDVRGHERCVIRRGPLPLSDKDMAKLKKMEYVVFTLNPLDEETFRKLSQRGLGYKRSDEWLAIKTTWVTDHQSPKDPKLPYVPAVRKLGNVRIRAKKPVTGSWTEDPSTV